MTRRPLSAALFAAALLYPIPAAGQDPSTAGATSSLFGPAAIDRAIGPMSTLRFDRALGERPDDDDKDQERRACAGCPVRRLLRPYLESLAIDVMYNGINHLRGHHTARVGFKSLWQNMRHGFEWDVNPWLVNQIGHPYQGSNYYTAGRANGLSFWESSAVAAFGSATWEFFAENNRASLNDLINTTLGGIALGEVMYRAAWLVRDPTKTGKTRRLQELVATAIDPMTGLTRALSGDMKRVVEKPPDMIPSSVTTRGAVGVLLQGTNIRQASATARPFIDMDVDYGSVRTGSSRVPFGAFTLQFAAGGGSAVSELVSRGRLLGHPFGQDARFQFSIFQTFDFMVNRAYAFGGQGFEAEVAATRQMSRRLSLWMAATGGATVLAAVDTLLPAPSGVTIEPDLLDRRSYDYGPGLRFGGIIQMLNDNSAVATLSYQGYQVSVVDGTRSNHVLQRLHLDLRLPLKRALAVGVAGEYFFRKAYFWPTSDRTDKSPQFRAFVAWSRR